MLSVENVGLSKGRSYYTSENYYSKESAQDHSQWYGLLAAQLGLSGKVIFSDFDNILFGFDKEGKQALAQNAVDPKNI